MDVNKYFAIDASKYDINDNVTLDSTKRSHRWKFQEKVDEYIDQLNLLDIVTEKCNQSITEQEIERLDETIGFVLDSARKYVEGMKRNVPYSKKKMKLRAKKNFYISRLKQLDGRRIDKQAMRRKQEIAEIENMDWSREELQSLRDEAVNELNEYKNNIIKEKDEELLDSYPEEIIEDSEEKRNRRR